MCSSVSHENSLSHRRSWGSPTDSVNRYFEVRSLRKWTKPGFELVTYTPHCSGETKWVLPTPCATHWEVNTDRGYTWSFKHLRRHCFQSWFLNYDSLSNANLCYERLVAGSKVLSSSTKTRHEPRQPGKRLLTRPDHCSTQILCERYPSPTPWSVFCLEIYINFLSCYYTGRSRDIYMQGQNPSHLFKPI